MASYLPFLNIVIKYSSSPDTLSTPLKNDFKSFNISNRKIGIGQMTVIDYEKVLKEKDKYLEVIEKISKEHDYDIMAFCNSTTI